MASNDRPQTHDAIGGIDTLLENWFVPTGFGREHNSTQDEYLPVIRFEAAESVAGRVLEDDG